MEEQAIDLPPLPESDGSASVVVGHQRVGEMTADVVEEIPAWSESLVQAYARAAVLAERERCANLCNDYSRYLLNLADGAGEHCETEAHAAEACFHLIMGRNEYGDDPGSEHFGDSFAAIRST